MVPQGTITLEELHAIMRQTKVDFSKLFLSWSPDMTFKVWMQEPPVKPTDTLYGPKCIGHIDLVKHEFVAY